MNLLTDPNYVRDLLSRHGFSFQKKYGQNFLIDERVPESIVEAAGVGPRDFVLEIGPGIGTMTRSLSAAAGRVLAVEVDRALIPILKETLVGCGNVTVLNQDILKTDLCAIAQEYNEGRPMKVVANLPYYITTPILMALFESRAPLDSVTVMVQKEVAERMKSGPGSKAYGALSLAVQYYSRPEIAFTVPPHCFVPRPNVESAVIRMDCWKEPPVSVPSEDFLFAVIRAAFNQRRKTLPNALANFGGLVSADGKAITREDAAAALEKMDLPATIRGEALSLAQFAQLSSLLYGAQNGAQQA